MSMTINVMHVAPTRAGFTPELDTRLSRMEKMLESLRPVSFPTGVIEEVEKATGWRYSRRTVGRWTELGVVPLGGIRPGSRPLRHSRCKLPLFRAGDGSEYSTVGAIRSFLGRVWGATEGQP